MNNYKLTIDLVPKSAWYSNVRSMVDREKWDKIRNISYRLANHKCEICGDTGKNQGFNHDVECHEIWEYVNPDVSKRSGSQNLISLISLCPLCHKCKHYGLAQMRGEEELIREHLMKVNGITQNQLDRYIDAEFEAWVNRNYFKWHTDISYVDKFLNDNDTFEAFMSKY